MLKSNCNNTIKELVYGAIEGALYSFVGYCVGFAFPNRDIPLSKKMTLALMGGSIKWPLKYILSLLMNISN